MSAAPSLRLPCALFAFFFTLCLGACALAQEGNQSPDNERRLRAMGQEIEELQRLGRHAEAEELARRAREMRGNTEANQRERILHGLEMGREAARMLGDMELVAALERAMERARRGGRERQGEQQANRPRQADQDGANRELQEARRQLDVLRMARPALAEGERRDAVDLLDRAIRARELGLEGRRDEEAMAMRRRAPDRAQLAEILGVSAELWAEFGHEDKARMVRELAGQMGGRGRGAAREREQEQEREREREQEGERGGEGQHEQEGRQREQEGQREHEQEGERGQNAEHDRHHHELHRRVEELEARTKALQNQIEELRAALRRRDR